MTTCSLIDPGTVSIIIPQFNQPALTIRAIQTLRQIDPVRWPVLVVDNGSSPSSIRQLHDLRDSAVQILSLPHAGLTLAWNTAAVRSGSDHLIFLNNDTVSHGPWVEALLTPLKQGLALVAGVVSRRERHVSPPVDLPAGWCFAVSRQTFESVHGFDATMQLYFSDTDFLLRVRERFANECRPAWIVVPGLPIAHVAHGTAHRLPHQKAQWQADRKKFLTHWQGHR